MAKQMCMQRCGIEGEDGTVTKVVKTEATEVNCGFVGESDPGGFYSRGNRVERQLAASGSAPMVDSKGRLS